MRPRGLATAFARHPHIDDDLVSTSLPAAPEVLHTPAAAQPRAAEQGAACAGGAGVQHVDDVPAEEAGREAGAAGTAACTQLGAGDSTPSGQHGSSAQLLPDAHAAQWLDAWQYTPPTAGYGSLHEEKSCAAQEASKQPGSSSPHVLDVPLHGGGPCLSLVLSFALPSSAYATMLVRELLKASTAAHDHKAATQGLREAGADAVACGAGDGGVGGGEQHESDGGQVA